MHFVLLGPMRDSDAKMKSMMVFNNTFYSGTGGSFQAIRIASDSLIISDGFKMENNEIFVRGSSLSNNNNNNYNNNKGVPGRGWVGKKG